MKPIALLLALTLAGIAQADTIRLTTGKTMTGRVLAYASGTFEVEDEKQMLTRLPAATVLGIDFGADATATLDTRTRGQVKGKLTKYAAGHFELVDAQNKTEKIPGQMVTRADLGSGGGGSSADIESVNGNDLTKHLAQGQVTIVTFYADWCGPCRALLPKLEQLAKADDAVVLRKVNVDKNKALASEYKVRGIPHIVIFDKAGANLGTVVGGNLEGIKRYVEQGKGNKS